MEKTEKTYLKIACVVPLFRIKVLKSLERLLEFPGGSVVTNLPCSVGDVGLIPGGGTKVLHAMEHS